MKSDFDRIRGLAANCLQQSHELLEWVYLDNVCADPAETVIKRLLPELRTTLIRTREVLGHIGESLARPDTPRFCGKSGRSHCEVAYNWSRDVFADVLQAIDTKQGLGAADDVAAEIDWSTLPEFTVADIRAGLTARLPNEADIADRIAWADAETRRAMIAAETAEGGRAVDTTAGETIPEDLDWPEITPSEIAKMLGVSLATVRQRTGDGGDIRVKKLTERRLKVHPDDLARLRVTMVEREKTKAALKAVRTESWR